MRYILTLAALFMALPLLDVAPATAGTTCSRQDVNIDGNDFAGDPFSFPARIGGPAPDPNIGLSEQDCVNNQSEEIQKARRDGRRAASIAASMDAYGWGEGLNVTLNGANSGVGNDDTYAAGLVLGYKHTFANPAGGVIHSISGKVGGAADTTGSDYGASVGLTLNFGTF